MLLNDTSRIATLRPKIIEIIENKNNWWVNRLRLLVRLTDRRPRPALWSLHILHVSAWVSRTVQKHAVKLISYIDIVVCVLLNSTTARQPVQVSSVSDSK